MGYKSITTTTLSEYKDSAVHLEPICFITTNTKFNKSLNNAGFCVQECDRVEDKERESERERKGMNMSTF